MITFQINFQIQEHESYVGTNQINILIILTIFEELPKKILWTNAGGYRGRGRPKSRYMGLRKTQGNWVVEIGGWMSRIEDVGDICFRKSRSTQGCRADGDDDDSL